MRENKLVNAFLAFGVLLCIIISCLLLALSIQSLQQRSVIKKQNDFLVCILQVQPSERTQAVVDKCRKDNL